MTIEFDREIFNEVYFEAFNNQSRHLHLVGGAGSGKSYCATQKCLIRILKEKGHKILYCRKVAKTIRTSQFALFRETISQWQLTKFFKVQKSTMDITCINGNQLIASGLDDVEKLKSISGITSIWIEEATELEEEDSKQLDLRLRGVTQNYKQIIYSYNPIDIDHWLNKANDKVTG